LVSSFGVFIGCLELVFIVAVILYVCSAVASELYWRSTTVFTRKINEVRRKKARQNGGLSYEDRFLYLCPPLYHN